MKITSLIFDLGGVLINLDPERTRQSFIKLGIPHFDQLFTVYKSSQLFEDLETGHVDPDTFIKTLQEETAKGSTEQDIIDAWNAMLLDFRLESLDFVKQLKALYPTFLFSNTNIIHHKSFQQTIKETTPYSSVDELFHKAYYSHEIGRRKPIVDAYRYIITEKKLDAGQTLFIDDNKDNILGAKEAGLQTLHLLPGERVENVLSYLL
ncbi:MAG: HAD family hydrolase [Chitinophagaceae bacterium]